MYLLFEMSFNLAVSWTYNSCHFFGLEDGWICRSQVGELLLLSLAGILVKLYFLERCGNPAFRNWQLCTTGLLWLTLFLHCGLSNRKSAVAFSNQCSDMVRRQEGPLACREASVGLLVVTIWSMVINGHCPPSMVSPYASLHQVVSLHLRRWSSTPDQPTSTHGNYPGTVSNPIRAYRPNGRTQSRSGLPRLLCIGRDHQDDGGWSMDEDGAERPRLPRAVMGRRSRPGPEPTSLEAVDNQWRYALVVVQAGEEEEEEGTWAVDETSRFWWSDNPDHVRVRIGLMLLLCGAEWCHYNSFVELWFHDCGLDFASGLTELKRCCTLGELGMCSPERPYSSVKLLWRKTCPWWILKN